MSDNDIYTGEELEKLLSTTESYHAELLEKKRTDELLRRNRKVMYEDMDKRCRQNIHRINILCSSGGGSFSEHRTQYDACKEWLQHKSFPSCEA